MSDEENQDTDQAQLRSLLKQLKSDHRRVDSEIVALRDIGTIDMLKLVRMKKIKLVLKDKIALVEDRLLPDIIA